MSTPTLVFGPVTPVTAYPKSLTSSSGALGPRRRCSCLCLLVVQLEQAGTAHGEGCCCGRTGDVRSGCAASVDIAGRRHECIAAGWGVAHLLVRRTLTSVTMLPSTSSGRLARASRHHAGGGVLLWWDRRGRGCGRLR
jgi:hypothetical protein